MKLEVSGSLQDAIPQNLPFFLCISRPGTMIDVQKVKLLGILNSDKLYGSSDLKKFRAPPSCSPWDLEKIFDFFPFIWALEEFHAEAASWALGLKNRET